MPLLTERWNDQQQHIPHSGQHILAQHTAETIVVYQAYMPAIADYAVKHQQFGGPNFGYGRMSWIKPNFLWMMFRCGWCEKQNQERVLAITITRTLFDEILFQAAHSSFNSSVYPSHEEWKKALAVKPVRLQWDPDHDPHGKPLTRRAIQLGLKDDVLHKFGTTALQIEDVTPFVREQKQHVDNRQLDLLEVPQERIYVPADAALVKQIELDV